MMSHDKFSITNKTRQHIPPKAGLLFARIKDEVLGKNYELSLVFAGNTRTKNLNKKYRDKNYIPNVLSFPLAEDAGEIFINPCKVRKDAPIFKKRYNEFVGYLFIHSILHLKGFTHGAAMEAQEEKLVKKFKLISNLKKRN